MKKLDDVPKKNIFDVPEGYFDRLPGIIQTRTSASTPSPVGIPSWSRVLRYALPLILAVGAGIYWYQNNSSSKVNVQSELASIGSDQLVTYLDNHELTTEEVVEMVAWSSVDLDDLENTVYSTLDITHPQLEELLDEYDEL